MKDVKENKTVENLTEDTEQRNNGVIYILEKKEKKIPCPDFPKKQERKKGKAKEKSGCSEENQLKEAKTEAGRQGRQLRVSQARAVATARAPSGEKGGRWDHIEGRASRAC